MPKRSAATGQLIGRGRAQSLKTLHALRDSIIQIKRYLYRRICNGKFEPLPQEAEVSKDTLRRFVVWLQPSKKVAPPTKTEVYCFNSRLDLKNQGGGTPAVLFPSVNRRMYLEFFNPSFERLKNWVYTKRCIPVGLLGLLSGKSCKQPSDRNACLFDGHKTFHRTHNSCNRRPFGSCGSHGTVANLSSQTGFVIHSGNDARIWQLPANRFLLLNRAQAI